MFDKKSLARPKNSAPRTTFLALFGTAFAVVLGSSVVLAFLLPDQYMSTARIKLERPAADVTPPDDQGSGVEGYNPYFIQTEFGFIQSEAVLRLVVKKLNLVDSWGKGSVGGVLSEADTLKLLKKRLHLEPVRSTSLVDIRVHSPSAWEAANIANELAATYRDLRSEQRRSAAGAATPRAPLVEIVDKAAPALSPVRPNKPLIVFLGLCGGAFIGILLGAAGTLVVLLNRRVSPRFAAA